MEWGIRSEDEKIPYIFVQKCHAIITHALSEQTKIYLGPCIIKNLKTPIELLIASIINLKK